MSRRELALLLRTMRTQAGMTVDDVAKALLCSPSKVSRLETGQRAVSLRDVRDLMNLYKVNDPGQREHLTALAKRQKAKPWWQEYDLPFSDATYIGFESEATRIRTFDPGVIPGILQIPEYARSVHERGMPRLSDSLIEQRVQLRESRRAIFTREDPPPPEYRAIIDEGVLHRVVSGPAVMSAALEYLIQACQLPSVTVLVLPYEAGAHPALDSTFILMDFNVPLPPLIYVEGLVGVFYLDRAQDVERYGDVFERLQTISLSQSQSVDLMTRVSAAYKGAVKA